MSAKTEWTDSDPNEMLHACCTAIILSLGMALCTICFLSFAVILGYLEVGG
jgi:hypothetical protein